MVPPSLYCTGCIDMSPPAAAAAAASAADIAGPGPAGIIDDIELDPEGVGLARGLP